MKHFLLLLFLFTCIDLLASPTIRLKKGLVITSSVIISRENYNLDADSVFDKPLLVIEGDNITVDFNNAVLQGSGNVSNPNQFYGLAILIKKGSANIVLKNASIHGFKVAVLAEHVTNLNVNNCNFSYNYRQQLHSNWQREDISDWMSFHHNEKDEWLRYGTGIYLKYCNKAVISNNIIKNGQCGLLMTGCDSAQIFDNNFSFNSALGIGMYRSSNNNIYHNRLDFNVRGFSFGKYYRGQDSAGILVFEQCNNNVFAYNSVTHSGDGFFLWAGQHTMDTGEGGCNDNLLYNNDFSYAPTNGVEVTFSRNTILQNSINGCDHGIWGGYSYNTVISQNKFVANRIAIAIEHGQANSITSNGFNNNKTSVKLWSREQQPADWIYAQKRNTWSMNYTIAANTFQNEKTVYDIMGTDSVWLAGDSKYSSDQVYKLGERVSRLDTSAENIFTTPTLELDNTVKRISFIPNKTIPINTFAYGRNQIRITEWGPYNFEYPLLFLDSISNGNYCFTVLHQSGSWRLEKSNGFTILYAGNDQVIAKADSSLQNRYIQLDYLGDPFKDMFGKKQHDGKPCKLMYSEFDPLAKWNILFYKWGRSNDPNKGYNSFMQHLSAPFHTTTANKIDFTWWGSIGKELPADSFATVATATIDFPAATYEIGLTADDMVKLFIDGKPVIDAWNKKYVELDENTHHSIVLHLEGKHDLKIVHAENAGLADLMLYIKPQRSIF